MLRIGHRKLFAGTLIAFTAAFFGCASSSYSGSSPGAEDADVVETISTTARFDAGRASPDAGIATDAGPPPDPDTCGNGFDDDLDGRIDEGCACRSGESQFCFPGLESQLGVGKCRGGRQICTSVQEFDLGWGPCEAGAIGPTPEDCRNGIDDDCNGTVDDGVGCVCTPGSAVDCYGGPAGTENVGACRVGALVCTEDGRGYAACAGEILPTAEVCGDGVDNDCDGLTDCQDTSDCPICLGVCELRHAYTAQPRDAVQPVTPGKVVSCGPGCTVVDVGQCQGGQAINDVYRPGGRCLLYEEVTDVVLPVPTVVTQALLLRAEYDDYLQVQINGQEVWRGPGGRAFPFAPGATPGARVNYCDRGNNYRESPNADLTAAVQAAPPGTVRFKTRVAADGTGEGCIRIRLLHSPPPPVFTEGSWVESNPARRCFQAADAVATGACTGAIACVDGPDASGCINVGGAPLCQSDVAGIAQPTPAGLSPLCRRAQVSVASCP